MFYQNMVATKFTISGHFTFDINQKKTVRKLSLSIKSTKKRFHLEINMKKIVLLVQYYHVY